jgi:hypothetical protein
MYTTLLIEYANPFNLNDVLPVEFCLRNHAFVSRWIDRVTTAQQLYPIDDPSRFYGFGSIEYQQALALDSINHCIDTINSYNHLIDNHLGTVHDQDTLNHLHHIFEIHHGLLDQQQDTSPLRYALADLNVLVHRCESVARGAHPRHVVTWYGLPKDHVLDHNDYALFTDEWAFVTVMLNYVEIGKTLEDLTLDQDQYIADDAFRPYRHYSADFNVKYYTTNPVEIKEKHAKITAYYAANQDRFGPWSVTFTPGSIPLADIVTNIDLDQLAARQYVKSVKFK